MDEKRALRIYTCKSFSLKIFDSILVILAVKYTLIKLPYQGIYIYIYVYIYAEKWTPTTCA